MKTSLFEAVKVKRSNTEFEILLIAKNALRLKVSKKISGKAAILRTKTSKVSSKLIVKRSENKPIKKYIKYKNKVL